MPFFFYNCILVYSFFYSLIVADLLNKYMLFLVCISILFCDELKKDLLFMNLIGIQFRVLA